MLDGAGVVLALDVQRAGLPAAGEPHGTAAGEVVADLADGPDRVVQGEVAELDPGLDHLQHQVRRPHLEQRRHLAHVRVADDHVQAAVALGVGVRLVAGVDDRPRPGGGAGDALPDVLGALAQAVDGAARGLQHLARAADELAGDEEGQQDVGDPGELPCPRDQVVLVAAVGVARGVGVVLEQVDVAADALVDQPPLGVDQEVFEDPFAGLVVGDELGQRVALGGGVLGVAAHVQVEPGTVAQEHVRRPAPRHDPAEQVARHLVRGQAPLAMEGARDPELGLETEDPPLHAHQPKRCTGPGGTTASGRFPAVTSPHVTAVAPSDGRWPVRPQLHRRAAPRR